MRKRGLGRMPFAGRGRRGLAALLCGALIAVASHASGVGGQIWARTIGELVIAPANAHRSHKRSNSDKASDEVRKAEAAQRQLQQLQQAEAAQKRIQNIHNMVAAQQKRMQQLQQIETTQKKVQQIQQMQASHQHVMAKFKERAQAHRHDVQRPASTPKQHQALLQHVMAKLRHHSAARNDGPSHAAFGGNRHHHSALQSAMSRFKDRHHQGHGRSGNGHSGNGHHESRQHAAYRHIWSKLSRHGRRSKEETVVTAPSTPASSNQGSGSSGRLSLLQDRPDVGNASSTVGSKLDELVTNASQTASSTSDNSGMSRLGGPQTPTSEKDSAKSKTTRKDDDADDDTAKQAGRGLGRRVAGELLPPPGTFRPNEVLAINLNAAGMARALARNFKVIEKVSYPALGFNITRLETPTIQNALIGRSTLQEELPADGFGLNHIYVAGRPTAVTVPSGADAGADVKSASVPSKPAAPGTAVPRSSFGCTPDRCFGISVINWRPQLATCARGIKIGIIDTGIDKSHPAFAGVRFEHRDFISSNSKKPSNQHGTGVFSLLAGNPRSTTPGLVPDATFLVGDAFFADRNGYAVSDTVTMLKALNWLKASGVDIANLSFAGPPDELVHDAIRELAKTGTVILAAAGNEGQDAPPSYPAGYREVVAVTAVDRNLAAYAYANRGNHIDVAAPGVDIWTALPNRREGPQTGTSFAVPFVTSVVALSYPTAEQRTDGDPLAPKQRALALLQKGIKSIGSHGRTPIFGAGLVQAPSHCDPRAPAAVASTGPRANEWAGTVQVAPSVGQPQPGAWASTVHPVANTK